MSRFQLYITLFWIALGVFVSAYSYRLGLGGLLTPGAGLFPFGLGVAIGLLGLYKLVKEFLFKAEAAGAETGTARERMPKNLIQLLVLAVTLLAYALLLEPLGFLVTTFLGMACLLRIAGYRKWVPIIAYAAIISGVTYFGFTYLGTTFPPGILSYVGLH
jgi:putative tricarboxylic transport membrane protein